MLSALNKTPVANFSENSVTERESKVIQITRNATFFANLLGENLFPLRLVIRRKKLDMKAKILIAVIFTRNILREVFAKDVNFYSIQIFSPNVASLASNPHWQIK